MGNTTTGFVYTKKLRNPSSVARPRSGHYGMMNHYNSHTLEVASQPASVSSARRNSLSGAWQDISPGPMHYWGVDESQSTEPIVFSYEPFEVPYAAEVHDAAMAKLYGNLRKAKESGLDLSLVIGEMPQTWNLLASTAARVNRSYRALRRGKLREAYNALGVSVRGVRDVKPHYTKGPVQATPSARETARWRDAHLEWTYGVMPLLQDVDAAAKKLADILSSKPVLCRVGGSGFMNEHLHEEVRPRIEGQQSSCNMDFVSVLKVKHVLWYTVEDAMVAHAESLGLLNPLSTAWQASPLTFVFDWMYNLGGWLKNLSAFLGLSFHSGCTSRSGDSTRTYTYGGIEQRSYASHGVGYDENGQEVFEPYLSFYRLQTGGSIRIKRGGFIRDLWSGLPAIPLPRLRLPATADNALSKLTSSLELLHQRRASIKPETVPAIYRDIPIRRNR